MKFVKENLFLICTAGATVVGVVVLLVMARSAGKEADGYADLRTRQSRKIAPLVGSGVNTAIVEAERARVDEIKEAAREVADYCLERNSKGYEVIRFDVGGGIQAFPIDLEVYRRESLLWRFPQEYQARLRKLLERLDPTAPPSQKEIDAVMDRLAGTPEDKTTRRTTPEVMTNQSRRPNIRGGPIRPNIRGGPARPNIRGGTSSRRPSSPVRSATGLVSGGEVDEGPTPQQEAQRNLILSKSRQGEIYADEGSLDVDLEVERASDYTNRDLWMAQVGLWVQKDIIEAIWRTNWQARSIAPAGSEKGVPGSAIKRLVKMNVRGYVLGRTGSSEAGKRASGPEPTREGAVYLGGPVVSTGGEPPPGLTGRVCNELYDVVHYDLTVIAPAKYLPRLYENLRLQNFHTVLDVKISSPGGGEKSGSSRSQEEGGYYYGTDSIVQATITGEMLLLADWTRGRWNSEDKAWDKAHPELMPEEFLREMCSTDTASLREEDNKRIGVTAASAAPAPDARRGVRR